MKTVYEVHGMHCGACVDKIQKALQPFASAEVTLNPPRATLSGDSIPELGQLNQALKSAGYYRLSELADHSTTVTDKSWFQTYLPLLLIVGILSLVSFYSIHNSSDWMLNFMAGFFIVFGTFKLFDLRGFQNAYASYDLLAKQYPTYGLVYPFIELALGFAFLFRYQITFTLYATIAVMTVGSLGVLQALRNKQAIRCACLGTSLNLPMSTVTLVEDLVMVLMSVAMLLT